MRAGVVIAATILVGACASIVDLDHADGPVQGGATTTPGDHDGGGDGGKSSSSGAASSGAASSGAASSGASPVDAAADTGPKPPTKCKRDEECPEADKQKCTNAQECGPACTPHLALCGELDLPVCCIGLLCTDSPLGKVCREP